MLLIDLVCGGATPEITQVTNIAHQLFILIQIFCNEVLVLVYIYNIPHKKVTFILVHGKQLVTSSPHSIPNVVNRNMSLWVNEGD